jgi:hypothetical protein
MLKFIAQAQMMFRTELHPEPSQEKISLQQGVLSVGSCFAEVIGKRLLANKFKAMVNPFGTIYNPASIFRLIHDSINAYMPSEDSYLSRQDLHFNFKFHSDFAASSRESLKAQLAHTLLSTREHLRNAEWVIITLGTAFVYERQDNGRIVANCHKLPTSYFQKRLLDPGEILTRFEQLYFAMNAFNPRTRFIFTLSPVRHLRDTLVQNSVSKAALRLAIEMIRKQFSEKVQYFPSYEIMMDDLRDYRFYAPDLIHPNEVAENFIWEKWVETFVDDQAIEFMAKWEKVHKAMSHRPFQPKSEEHQKFVQKTIELLQHLSKVVDVSQELKKMKKQLK